MSRNSTYIPKSAFAKWIDARLPLPRLIHDAFTVFPTPKNLNIWYTFGGILAFCLAVQIITGIVLAMHYTADAQNAFDAIERIMRDVNYGWLIRYIHANGASLFFIAVYTHMFRGLYYGSYKSPRELLWIIGVVIYLLMMATAFLGYVLPWSQTSYWGATVIINLFSSIPLVGEAITTWLQGDFSVSGVTLNRFFSLHYLLPFLIAGFVALHIWALHAVGNNNPLGLDVKSPRDTVPFHPYYTTKDTYYLVLFVILFAFIVFYLPNLFGNADNYRPAEPLETPSHIVPEWYFLTFYAMLRSIPHKLGGAIVIGGAVLTLFFVPWLDTSPTRSNRFRPLMKPFFWALVAACFVLGYCGAQTADAAVAGVPLVWVARLGTFYYFAFFWLVMPIIGLVETPTRLPVSIAQAVMDDATADATVSSGRAQAWSKLRSHLRALRTQA